jgi:agmatine deiminase
MNDLLSSAFFLPAEFSKHSGCLLIWPDRPDTWGEDPSAAQNAFAHVISAIAASEKVYVLVNLQSRESAEKLVGDVSEILSIPSDDSWARDVSPTFLTDGNRLLGINWSFNAWGGEVDGLYFPYDRDNAIAPAFCRVLDIPCLDRSDFVLEGGSIHSDGEGTLLVTEECLLSAGRNPSLTKQEIEKVLCQTLSVQKILWLPYGIYQDETNGHVDNIATFAAPGRVILAWTDDPCDPQYARCLADFDYLNSQTDAKGRHLEIVKLPLPKPIYVTREEADQVAWFDGHPTRTEGERLAASYVNFYLSNGAVVMPFFGDPHDQLAAKILGDLFPTRTVVPISARTILLGGGNIHCITAQIPAVKD